VASQWLAGGEGVLPIAYNEGPRTMQKPVTDSVAALKSQLETQGVKFLMPTYVDMHGISKTKIVPINHIAQMVGGSELCTGAALDGVPQDVSDEEVSAHPDIESVTILPWDREVAWFASDLWCGGNRSSRAAGTF
jgi:glutamine synthetase